MSENHKINYIEFPTLDIAATKAFFNKAFGWEFQDYGPDYAAFTGQGTDGGFFKSDLCARTSTGSVLVVLNSDNLEDSLSQVKQSGGKIIQDIFSFPGGRRFHFTEPGGNELAIWGE